MPVVFTWYYCNPSSAVGIAARVDIINEQQWLHAFVVNSLEG